MSVRTVMLLAVVLMSTLTCAEANNFKTGRWLLDNRPFVASFVFQAQGDKRIEFIQKAGSFLEFDFVSPVILTGTHTVKVFSVSSPLSGSSERILLGVKKQLAVGDAHYRKNLVFGQESTLFYGQLLKGYWLEIEILDKFGLAQTLVIPSVGFRQPAIEFNRFRNTLPPISWNDARAMTLRFASGQSELSADHKRQLNYLLQYVEYDQLVASLTIDGHSDSTGTRLSNLSLSGERAEKVKNYLLNQGLDKDKLTAVRKHGQRYPLAGMPDEMNRRVEIHLARDVLPEKEKNGNADD